MFGTSMHWSAFFLCIVIGIIAIYQLIYIIMIKKKTDLQKKVRYLLLSLIFLLYILLNALLPYPSFPYPFIFQYIITYGIAITMCVYAVWYLVREFDINLSSYLLKTQSLFLILISSFLVFFIIPYFIFSSLDIARLSFIFIPIFLSVFLVNKYIKLLNSIGKNHQYFNGQILLGQIAIFPILMLPILTLIGDYQFLTFPIVSLTFFLITVMEIKSYMYKLKSQYVFGSSDIDQYYFTSREKEIVLQIIEGYNYNEIAENMFISSGTVRKHASNIFIKTGVTSKKDLLRKINQQ